MNTLSLLSGFLVIFTGVYLLNISRADPDGHKMINGADNDGIATDIVSGIQTRRSMQARRSLDPHRLSLGSNYIGDRQGLIRAYDEEEGAGLGLTDLAEESGSELSLDNVETKLNGHETTKLSYDEERTKSPLQR